MPQSTQPFFVRRRRDRGGNVGVLLLMTIFALVALLALVWNTGEVGTRRQKLQTAADTSAHAAASWMSRSANVMAAQNMVICQDGSMEVIWRAITPTDQAVRNELQAEQAAINSLLANGDAAYLALRTQMLQQLVNVDNQYAMANGAWAGVSGLAGQGFTDPVAGQQFQTRVREAGLAMQWIQNTYVSGQPSTVATWPGPPGPGGLGLRQLVANWSPPTDTTPFLQAILASIQQQLAVLVQFETVTAPGLAQNVPAIAANHETEVFTNEQTMAQSLADTINRQLQAQADFYSVRLTLATTGLGASATGPAQVQAPFVPAADVPVISHYDSIQGTNIAIDPINVHTDDSAIVYGNAQAPAPPALLAQFPGIQPTFNVNCDIFEGWGHIYAAPIQRYFNGRVWKDSAGLRVYMQQIDTLRAQLATLLAQLRNLGPPVNVTALPFQLQDPQADPNGVQETFPVLPKLTAPAGASDQLVAAVMLYNQHGAAYTGAVRNLTGALTSWQQFYNRYTQAFAVSTWNNNVEIARRLVIKQLGVNKQFMVLASYQLRAVPAWAANGMSVSSQAAICDRIISDNIASVAQNILNAMVAVDPRNLGSGFLDPAGRNAFLSASYSGQASQFAFQIVQSTATQVAPIIAAEWVSRPWPYEITPPSQAVPPVVGMSTSDRHTYFTILTAARSTPGNSPKFFMGKLMGNSPTPQLLAHAQAEAFNWMEFNSAYGGSEVFDQITGLPNQDFTGCPLPWRLSTIGGWSWNARLAVADALADALDNNPEFQSFFTEGGVTGNDPLSLQTLALH